MWGRSVRIYSLVRPSTLVHSCTILHLRLSSDCVGVFEECASISASFRLTLFIHITRSLSRTYAVCRVEWVFAAFLSTPKFCVRVCKFWQKPPHFSGFVPSPLHNFGIFWYILKKFCVFCKNFACFLGGLIIPIYICIVKQVV